MAQRRMFAKTIIDSDAFLDMPLSTQALYFHLAMRADDDGFINNPKRIQKTVNCSEDDLKVLFMKNFIIPFETGICVIKHWRIHNYIQRDRYKETLYKEEKAMLGIKENGSYTKIEGLNLLPLDECIQPVSIVDTQDRLGKDRLEIDKDSIEIDKDSIISSSKSDVIIEKWNSLGLQKLSSINYGTNRYKLLNKRIAEYGMDKMLEAIEKIKNSSFLQGKNDKGWTINFDWFVKPNNFPKVLEGNYDDKERNSNNGIHGSGKNSNESKSKYSKYNFDK